MANLLTRAPKGSQPGAAAVVRTIYQQLSPEKVHPSRPSGGPAQGSLPPSDQMLADALTGLLVFTGFPVSHWQKL